jgi:predicted PurR-regulated permease PerM
LLMFAGVLSFSLGGVVGVLVATQPNQQEIGGIVPIAMGIVGALAFTYAAQRVEVKRLYYLAAFSIGIGLAIGTLGIGVVLGLSFFYLGIGLAQIVTGGVALVQYLRSHEQVDLNGVSQ